MNDDSVAALVNKTGGEIAAKKLFDGYDAAPVTGDAGDVAGGFDAQHLYVVRAIMLREVAVVAGDLNRQ